MFAKILLQQARHRWQVTALLWLAMTALVSLYVYVGSSARFSNRSMQLIMKRMGHHLTILPKKAEPREAYLCTDRQVLFPDTVTAEMAKRLDLDSRYYTSVLQERRSIDGHSLVLTGIRPVHRPDETREKRHLTRSIPPGRVEVGARAADLLRAKKGGSVQIGDRSFAVDRVRRPEGTLDDYRIYLGLADAQAVLDRPGQINVIRSFLCMHRGTLPEVERHHRATLATLFPEYQAVTQRKIAVGRDLARRTTSGYLYYLLTLVLGITVVIIAVTGLQEVTERRQEVGILLAMGVGYSRIIALYVTKLLIIAAVASLTGFLIGSALSREFLSPVLVTHTRPVAVQWSQFPRILLLTSLVVLLASAVPMAKLLRLDPNVILTEE
jgi:predicted lysophospholipase L1 biosynthesis ABC-type transport system permease subunit